MQPPGLDQSEITHGPRHDQSAAEPRLLVHTCTWLGYESHVSSSLLVLGVLCARDVTGTPNPHTLFDVLALQRCNASDGKHVKGALNHKIEENRGAHLLCDMAKEA